MSHNNEGFDYFSSIMENLSRIRVDAAFSPPAAAERPAVTGVVVNKAASFASSRMPFTQNTWQPTQLASNICQFPNFSHLFTSTSGKPTTHPLTFLFPEHFQTPELLIGHDLKWTKGRLQSTFRFGGLGPYPGNLTYPSGIVFTADQRIVIADTGNHAIKVFDYNGHFKYKFGEQMAADGKWCNPSRVDIIPRTQDIVALYQNPEPQIKIFTLNGHHVRSFGKSLIKYPRSICVDERGLILVADSGASSCHIFSPDGRRLMYLDLQKTVGFPRTICAYNSEFYIFDQASDCIKVFDYNGWLVRRIGNRTVTFPAGVDINTDKGTIIVAHNSDRFLVDTFTLHSGVHLSRMRSGIRHTWCHDIAVKGNLLALVSLDSHAYMYTMPK